MLITEDDIIEYKNESELSYFDDGGNNVALYVNKVYVGDCKVWKDSEMDGREYITLNHAIVYLDTLAKDDSLPTNNTVYNF
jgi:hypothetical protein